MSGSVVLHHLYDFGRHRIVLIKGSSDHEVIEDRAPSAGRTRSSSCPFEENLFADARRTGVTAEIVRCHLGRGLTAFVTENDTPCKELLESVASLGLRTPDDLSVASLGNLINDVELPLAVTRLDIPRQEMGRPTLRPSGAARSPSPGRLSRGISAAAGRYWLSRLRPAHGPAGRQ